MEKNSYIYEIINNKFETRKDSKIIDYYLCNCSIDKSNKCSKDLTLLIKNDKFYSVNNNMFANDSKADVKIQNSKVKLFYFKHDGSQALLTCFRKEISKNKSEFRFLPEDEAVLKHDDYSEIYHLSNSDTINKLPGVDGISIDKFAFSKFLGKYLRIGTLINNHIESNFEKDIKKIFNNLVIIENFTTWEKVFEFLVVNNKFETLKNFIIAILEAIKNTVFHEKNNSKNIYSINESLTKFFHSALCRALSHNWGPSIKAFIQESIEEILISYDVTTFDYFNILKYRQNYCKTRMCDKYIMPALIDALIDTPKEEPIERTLLNDSTSINLTDFNNFVEYASNFDYELTTYRYYPYVITPQDLSISLTISKLKEGKPLDDILITTEHVNTKYLRMNYPNLNLITEITPFRNDVQSKKLKKDNVFALKVGSSKKKIFRIAVANAILKHEYFRKALTDVPDRSYRRYNKLSKIINTAIENKSDILLIPESYIPFEWLPTIARISAKSQMAIITGIQHIKFKNTIYNLTATILPYSTNDYRFANISFHTKVLYSPEELRWIHGYRLNEMKGNTYDLFLWNDLWFSTYCCYELASIKDRSIFQSFVDMLAIVEWNKDVNYYSNIIESLSRDMHCYCVQVNSSDFGDSRITQPSKTIYKDIVKTKGGLNATVLVGEINIDMLRKFQLQEYELQKDDKVFKPTPPNFNTDIVNKKLKGELWDHLDKLVIK